MALKYSDKKTGRYLPVIYPDEKPYWEAAKAHRLILQCCKSCGKIWYPIGPVCPACLSAEFEWAELSGRGTIHNFVIVHKAWIPYYNDRVPYAVVQVELAEGPRLTTNFLDTPIEKIKIGLKVGVAFEDVSDEITLVQFRLTAF